MRALALALIFAACAVDLGRAPDAGPCMASPAFFASDVWPDYLDLNKCASAGCHDFTDGHGYLRYHLPPAAPGPDQPLESWPESWRLNYLTSIQLLRCDDPPASRLLSVPAGMADPHPVGAQIEDLDRATQLFRDWVSQ
jgi:hypothetical protein